MIDDSKNKSNNKSVLTVMRKNKLLLGMLAIVIAYAFFKIGNKYQPIEKLSVPSAIGYDILKKDGRIFYEAPISVYNYPDQNVSTMLLSGEAGTLTETRGIRQLQSNGKFVIGLERALVIGEDAAWFGIKPMVDALFSNRTVNDTGYVVICKGKAKDILGVKIEGSPGPGEYISGLVEHLTDFNFIANNYRLIDTFVRIDSEGRSLILPYLEYKNNKYEMTGLALFSKDKMVKCLNIEEAKILNLLRESNVRGLVTIKKDEEHYANFYGNSKRTVKCYEEDGRFIFYIKLDLKGEMLSNSYYDNIAISPETIKKVEEDMKNIVEEECKEFIKKMQNEYKLDCLELGRYGVAKVGHDTGIDWDKAVSNADIRVTARVKITEIGRGDF
jgi:Ger(x)C family germination protein